MDNFDKIIKEKVDQFEVPYNDAHWAEMEGKLESIRMAKIKKTILGSAAGIIAIAIAAYLILPTVSDSKEIAGTTNNPTATEKALENEASLQPNKVENNIVSNDNEENATNNSSADENNSVDASVEENSTTEYVETTEENSTTIITDNTENTNAANENAVIKKPENVNPDFIVYNNKVCMGENVSFEPLSTDGPYSYVWNFGDGKISYKSNPSHAYEHAGDYDISLTIIDRQTGKEYTKIKRNQVVILASETGSFTYFEESKKHDDNKLKYPYTLFKVKNSCEGCSYKWNFGNGITAESTDPKTIYKKDGGYNVTLITENANGCVSSIERRVNIKNGVDLFAPNTFTPNQDDDNETFIPKGLVEWDCQFEMTIVNQTGNTIYKTTDQNEPWNGKMNNSGLLMPEGLYFWQVIITDAYGVKHSYQGDIKLMK